MSGPPKNAEVALNRDVAVLTIPDGAKDTLPAGTMVRVAQSLGRTYTIATAKGAKYRMDGSDGDAIGMPIRKPRDVRPKDASPAAFETAAREALRDVYDPELPVDVVNLGLIHELKAEPVASGGGSGGMHSMKATVRMGLTTPGCGMGDVLVEDVVVALKAVGFVEVDAKVVLFPVWNPNMMSDAARLKLGLM